MKSENNSSDGPRVDKSDTADPTKKDRLYQAFRVRESRDDELSARLGTRRQNAGELRSRLLAQLDALANEYRAEQQGIKARLRAAKLDVVAAHYASEEHCLRVGVRYVPGETTDETVLKVPALAKAEAARRLALAYGVGFRYTAETILKPLLTAFCWVISSLGLGLMFHLLNAKRLAEDPASLFSSYLALAVGGVPTFGLFVSITMMWKAVGTMVGLARPRADFIRVLALVTVITAVPVAGLICLDAWTMIQLNATRALLNPAAAYPVWMPLGFGIVMSSLYVLSLAGTAAAGGYNAAAGANIDALIEGDANKERKELKGKEAIKAALGSLSDVKVAEEVIQDLADDLKGLRQEFKREWDETAAELPEVPTRPEPDEAEEISVLHDRVRSAQSHYDAHILSRRGGIEASTDKGQAGPSHDNEGSLS